MGWAPSWGLWQLAQLIFPSRTGWCEVFIDLARSGLWHAAQVSGSSCVFSWARIDLYSWMPWHSVQATLRRACMLLR